MRRLMTLALLVGLPVMLQAQDGMFAPQTLWSQWNFDPMVAIAVMLPITLYWRGILRYRVSAARKGVFVAGMATLAIALISPLEAISGALFSAHMLQHLLLMLVAAPLLVWSHPLPALLRGLPDGGRVFGSVAHTPFARTVWHTLTQPMNAVILHIAALAVWHVPMFYHAAFESRVVHALEHASFFLTAALFWWVMRRNSSIASRLFAAFAVMMVSGLLGALMIFSTFAWYSIHVPTTLLWGMSALEDQRLAGLLMWVPSGLVYVACIALILASWLEEQDQRERHFPPTVEGVADAT